MLLFLASVLEQLDLAFEHVSKGGVHNARFGLMLTDNAVELILHQTAKDKAAKLKHYSYMREEYPHEAALDKALGRAFDAKVKFAKLEGNLGVETAGTIMIMHEFRNEVYHVGLQHEAILPELALFYFEVACDYIGTFEPEWFSWSSSQKMPERAKKYFRGDSMFPGEISDFKEGCASLIRALGHDAAATIAALADQMDETIEEQDTCIDVVADGVYVGQKRTRDIAVVQTQAWALAFSDGGTKFAKERGWAGSHFELVEWLEETYPFKFKRDPIPSWEKQAAKLRALKDPHAALAHYQSLMTETAGIREILSASAAAAEAEIDMLINRSRGN